MTPRILVTVSRSYRELSTMREALEQTHARFPDAVLVHGDDPDSDHKARGIWSGLGGSDEPWPADWAHCTWDCPHATHRKIRQRTGAEYCPGAGIRRNKAMVESVPDLALAFIDPKSRTSGAKRTAQMVEDAGIPTIRCVQGMTVRILSLPASHSTDCPVCGRRGWVQVDLVRWRDDGMYVPRIGRIRPCPLRSGADDLRSLLPQPVTEGDDVA